MSTRDWMWALLLAVLAQGVLIPATTWSQREYEKCHADRICRRYHFDGAEVQNGGTDCFINHPPVRWGQGQGLTWHTAVDIRLAADFEVEALGLQQLKRSQREQREDRGI